jgi:transcriptional regulator with XRE-family HTH domain
MALKMKELRRIRRSLDLTQEELAKRSGVSLAAIHKAETGAHSPRLSTLMALADGLGVSVHDLIPDDRPKTVEARKYFELSLDRLLGAQHRDQELAIDTASEEDRARLVEEIDKELEALRRRYAGTTDGAERKRLLKRAEDVSNLRVLAEFGPAVPQARDVHIARELKKRARGKITL